MKNSPPYFVTRSRRRLCIFTESQHMNIIVITPEWVTKCFHGNEVKSFIRFQRYCCYWCFRISISPSTPFCDTKWPLSCQTVKMKSQRNKYEPLIVLVIWSHSQYASTCSIFSCITFSHFPLYSRKQIL